jgi:hypothetical protein
LKPGNADGPACRPSGSRIITVTDLCKVYLDTCDMMFAEPIFRDTTELLTQMFLTQC